MSIFVVRFSVPVEVVVKVEARDEDAAADAAWEIAQEKLETLAYADGNDVAVYGDLDGIGAESVARR